MIPASLPDFQNLDWYTMLMQIATMHLHLNFVQFQVQGYEILL